MTKLNENWGKLPDEVYSHIKKLEWDKQKNLKERLMHKRKFPIEISLGTPTGDQILDNMMYFKNFINQWKNFPQQHWIKWQDKKYNTLGLQRIPVTLILNNLKELFEFLGPDIEKKIEKLSKIIEPLTTYDQRFYPILIQHLSIVEQLTPQESINITSLLQQLTPNMGKGLYLRSLPLKGIDTKFLENNKILVSALLDVLYNNAITQAGNLLKWLGCLDNPKGWLIVKPLCKKTQESLAGLPILQMDQHTLTHYELPANNILVVENIQSGLSLPELPDTIAVIGCGNNVNWLSAQWLKNKRVAYWGDIDSWGLKILSLSKTLCPHIQTLMMDEETLKLYKNNMVTESESYSDIPVNLDSSEKDLFIVLQSNKYNANRLEQEKLPNDYIQKKLKEWKNNQNF